MCRKHTVGAHILIKILCIDRKVKSNDSTQFSSVFKSLSLFEAIQINAMYISKRKITLIE